MAMSLSSSRVQCDTMGHDDNDIPLSLLLASLAVYL